MTNLLIRFFFCLLLLNLPCRSTEANDLPPPTTPFPHNERPELPLLMHQVFEVDITRKPNGKILRTNPQYYQSLRPTLPAVRSSHDGRLGFNWANLNLYLLSPEKINKPFMLSKPGPTILTNKNGYYSRIDQILSQSEDPSPGAFAGLTICNSQKAWEQPRKCGANDCYDLTYIGFKLVRSPNNPKNTFDRGIFRSRQVVIEVSNPKTSNATIKSINSVGPLRQKAEPVLINFDATDGSFMSFEPVTTKDGRLYVSRFSLLPVRGIDGAGDPANKPVDIYYMVAPESAAPCDAESFSYPQRMSRAHTDPQMRNPLSQQARYGIAEYPMKDSFGNFIPENGILQTYPWIDNEGNNLFFSTGGSTLYTFPFKFKSYPTAEKGRTIFDWIHIPNFTRYPTRCISEAPNCMENPYTPEDRGGVRGYAMLGSWTHGKTVLFDGMINHTDFGLRRGLQFHREVELYQPSNGLDGWIHIAAGRDSGTTGSGLNNELESYSENAEVLGLSATSGVIDSPENKFNDYPMMRPALPRDVVWTVSNSIGTEEIAFDDYMDSKALIISSMIPGAEFIVYPYNWDEWKLRDGFTRRGDGNADQAAEPVLLQNAATSENLPIPKWGYLNKGRAEPVALGGFYGRGLWLDGSNSVSYEFPRAITNSDYFMGLFFENRNMDQNQRTILKFPDSTEVKINSDGLWISKSYYSKAIPWNFSSRTWNHLGIGITNNGQEIQVYANGLKIESFQSDLSLFQIQSANTEKPLLILGNTTTQLNNNNGFHGWIDEFKLFSYVPTDEIICNHAFGSLHYVGEKSIALWKNMANRYPSSTHLEIYNQLPENIIRSLKIPNNGNFVCAITYDKPENIYRLSERAKEGLRSIREPLLFSTPHPESGKPQDNRLIWNANRANFLSNSFCLSCHSANERRGLGLGALAPGGVCEMNDPRRQPMQGILYLNGQISGPQKKAISSNFETLPKVRDTRTNALISDPLKLLNLPTGGSCNSFTPR